MRFIIILAMLFSMVPLHVSSQSCGPNDTGEYRWAGIYVRDKEDPDDSDTFIPKIREELQQATDELSRQTNGEYHFQFEYDENCEIAVYTAVIDIPNPLKDGEAIANKLKNQGFTSRHRKYLTLVDNVPENTKGEEGEAEDLHQNEDRPGQKNRNNRGVDFAIVYEEGWENSTPQHEMWHLMGAVQNGSPNSNNSNHCYDEQDVVCKSGTGVHTVCTTGQMTIDCNRDDYFNPDPEPGSYLDKHWNAANSRFLRQASSSG